MIYNLSPIFKFLSEEEPNALVWRERISSFFTNTEYDGKLQDWYYDTLLSFPGELDYLFNRGVFTDEYTGLFSFSAPIVNEKHSFNMAHFISKNYQHFYNKKLLTVCGDFGILNIQAKLCGINLVSSIQKDYLNIGTVLASIGNNCTPYPINEFDFEEEDAIIMSCVFESEDLSYKNWEFMLDKRLSGKDVFFTTNTFLHLKNFINYDKIELINTPSREYYPEDYAELSYGYTNKIYRLK